jgi:hypothetical protein
MDDSAIGLTEFIHVGTDLFHLASDLVSQSDRHL